MWDTFIKNETWKQKISKDEFCFVTCYTAILQYQKITEYKGHIIYKIICFVACAWPSRFKGNTNSALHNQSFTCLALSTIFFKNEESWQTILNLNIKTQIYQPNV